MKHVFTIISLLLFSFSQAQNINLAWAKNIGSATRDNALSVATDASGNVYSTGFFTGTADFDPGAGTTNLISAGAHDIFISKLNASGNFVWAIRFGSTEDDRGESITVDASGNIYVTGFFSGTADFDPGAGTTTLSSSFGYEIFVVKLDASGNLIWAKNMGDDYAHDVGRGIAVDASNNVYTTGTFQGTADFDPGTGTFYLVNKNNNYSDDIFVSKLDASGNFVWAAALGSPDFDRGNSIAVDASGNVYTTGIFSTTADFDPGAGTTNLTSAGSFDIFVSKLNSAGNFVWAKRIGSTSEDWAAGIILDASGNAHVTGYFFGTVDFDPNAGTNNLTSAGSGDIFVSKLDAAGTLIWAKSMGGTGFDNANTIALDASGNVYTTGSYNGTADFDPGAGTTTLTSAGANDMFISKLSSAGNYITAVSIGGPSDQGGNGIAVDASNNIYITGDLSGNADFDPGAGTFTLTSNGDIDIHIGKYSQGSTGSNITDYFRTKQSGNWNDVSTWESSPDNATWSAATLTPDFNSNTITIQNGHTVTLTANLTIDQTVINTGGIFIINPNIIVTINDGAGTDVTVNTGGYMGVRSTSAGTASIGNSAGTISGDVVVERYIPANANKAWRLLSIPTISALTVKATWQAGQASGVAGTPGIGTMITSNNGDPSFDFQTPGNSMLTYNAASNTWAGIANTNSQISTDNGYMLFVRGDRMATPANGIKTATSLYTLGALKQGNYPAVPLAVSANQFALIGNPYASQIDFRNVTKTSGIDNTFYVWDPKLTGANGVGAYQTLSYNGTNYIITPGGGSYAASGSVMNTIESGQAFFVHATSTGNISFTEAAKSAGNNNVFRIADIPSKSLITNLYSVNALGEDLADGTMNLFDNNYSNSIDAMDALKLTNFGVNLGLIRDGKILSVEKRNAIKENDAIVFNLSNTKQQQYRFEIMTKDLGQTGLQAFLADKYLKTNTQIDLNGTTSISFTVNSDAGSSAENRFSIVFAKPSSPVNSKPAIVVYPNPVQNGMIKLQMNNMPKGIYGVRLLNSVGQTILTRQINHAEGSSTETINVNTIKGGYMLEVVKPDNSKFTNKIIIN